MKNLLSENLMKTIDIIVKAQIVLTLKELDDEQL